MSCPVGGGVVAPGTRMCAVGDPRLPLQRRDVFLEVDGVAIDQIYSFMKDPRGYDVFRVNHKLGFFPKLIRSKEAEFVENKAILPPYPFLSCSISMLLSKTTRNSNMSRPTRPL